MLQIKQRAKFRILSWDILGYTIPREAFPCVKLPLLRFIIILGVLTQKQHWTFLALVMFIQPYCVVFVHTARKVDFIIRQFLDTMEILVIFASRHAIYIGSNTKPSHSCSRDATRDA